jgi:hypothetical protein
LRARRDWTIGVRRHAGSQHQHERDEQGRGSRRPSPDAVITS